MAHVDAAAPDRPQERTAQLRWLLVAAFLVSSSLNYLDRLLLAAVAPVLKSQYHLTDFGYGNLLALFAVTYALGSPLLGWLMDRFGLTRTMAAAVGLWSLASMATGFVRSYSELVCCRVVLGVGESGGIPGTAKAYATYLLPRERALGAGLGQVAISAGSLAAPLLAAWALHQGHWQWAFLCAGSAGILWIALWAFLERRFPAAPELTARAAVGTQLVRDRRLWLLIGANFLWMSGYTLWTNWTTAFLVTRFHLTTEWANRTFAWVPPIGGTAGALLGGYLSMRWIARGTDEVTARKRACLLASVCAPSTVAVALTPTPGWATFAISLSYFFIAGGSTNLYTIPVDLYGRERAGIAVSGLVAAYGATTFVFNPLIGWMLGRFQSYEPVCILIGCLPLAAYFLLQPVAAGEPARQLPG